ncbi:MAG: GNAT family N-acetyltransferase [bacterium]
MHALWHRQDEIILAFHTAAAIPSIAPGADVSISAATPDDHAATPEGLPPDASRRLFAERLLRGHVCFLARVGGEVVHYTWLGFGPWKFPDIGVEIPLSGAEAYLYDGYTMPRWRGRKIYPATAAVLLHHAQERGIRHVFARVARRNPAGIAGLERVGFRGTLGVTSMRLFGVLGIYRAWGDANLEDGVGLLVSRRARMRPGLLVWNGRGRSGFRLNLPAVGAHP